MPPEDPSGDPQGGVREPPPEECPSEGEPEAVSGLRPNDPVDAFADTVEEMTGDTMAVGHLPFMADMVTLLAGGTGVRFDPGTVVCLDRKGPRMWRILWMVGPRLLPE